MRTPTPLSVSTLRAAFPSTPIGFSDHTQGPVAAAMAVALGACVLEKHFTLSHDLPGPDHWFSEDPEGLAEWVATIRTATSMRGSPVVRPTSSEQLGRREYRRRVVAARDIAPGEIFDESAITLRRVADGRGLAPAQLDLLLGRAATRRYRAGEPIEF